MRTAAWSDDRPAFPDALPDGEGPRGGEVRSTADSADARTTPSAADRLVEQDDRLVIPAAGAMLDDEATRALRDAGQR